MLHENLSLGKKRAGLLVRTRLDFDFLVLTFDSGLEKPPERSRNGPEDTVRRISIISKIQLVAYYQCFVLIG